MNFEHGLICVAAAAFSALAADLDGRSLLSAGADKLSRLAKTTAPTLGLLLALVLGYLYWRQGYFYLPLVFTAILLISPAFLLRKGWMRNAVVSAAGGGIAATGIWRQQTWLIELGLFIAAAPWFAHRGMTHTIWAAAAWSTISQGFEASTAVPGTGLAASLGYLSHLAADTLTPGGVKWLFPLLKTNFRLPICKSGHR
jgi:inner membrane protein